MEIVRYVAEGVLFVLSAGLVLFGKKDKKTLKDAINGSSLVSTVFEAIVSVEQKYKSMEALGMKCADMKREEVINVARVTALTNGWKFDEESVKALIEKFIEFSKKVNSKKGGN